MTSLHHHANRWSLAAMLCILGMGCSEMSLLHKGDMLDEANDLYPEDTGESGIDTADAPHPLYWSIEGTLDLVSGEIQTETSSIVVTYWLDDNSQCSVSHMLSDGVTSANEDIDIYRLWSISMPFPFTEDETCPWVIPHASDVSLRTTDLEMGFGLLDDRLHGSLATQGYLAQSTSLYGLYLTNPSDSENTLVFGVAGTPEQFSSSGVGGLAGPIPDGEYQLMTLFLLPF